MFPVAETGFDPQASSDVYSNHVNRAMFDALYRYDHLARPYKIVPEHGGRAARDLGRRPRLDDPDQARDLLRRRSGVQGKEARAHRRGLRIFVEARDRSEGPLAQPADVRRQVRRRRSAGRQGEGNGQVRLRRADGGTERARSLHDPHQAHGAVVRPPVRPHDHPVGRRRARSDRDLRRRAARGRWRTRSAPAPTGSRTGGAGRRSCWRRIPASAKCATRRAPTRPTARSWRASRASGFRRSAASRSTSSRRAIRGSWLSRRAISTS